MLEGRANTDIPCYHWPPDIRDLHLFDRDMELVLVDQEQWTERVVGIPNCINIIGWVTLLYAYERILCLTQTLIRDCNAMSRTLVGETGVPSLWTSHGNVDHAQSVYRYDRGPVMI